MRYSVDAFEALLDEAEAQGGALLPDLCLPDDATFDKKHYPKKPHTERRVTCGCGNATRFVLVYEPESEDAPTGSGYVTACAVCDDVGHWPNFIDAVAEADPESDPRNYDDEEEEDG